MPVRIGLGGPALAVLAILAGCASVSAIMTGAPRARVAVAEVRTYSSPPPVYQEIAVLHASHRSVFDDGGADSTDLLAARLKAAAGKLGANGLLLDGFDQAQTLSIGSGAGTDSYSAHGSISLGLGASFGIFKTTGRARAIYVPPDSTPVKEPVAPP